MGGHHLEYDLRVVRELAARGIETNVYSHVQVSAEVRAAVTASAQLIALFRISPYRDWSKIDLLSGEITSFLDGAVTLAEDLTRVEKAELWMWPSIYAPQLYACALAKPSVALSGCIHTEPTFMAPNGRMWWRYAFLKAREAGLMLNIGAHLPALEQEYSPLTSDGRISRFPVAHDGAPSGVRKTELRKIGFFGYQRPEKGAALLPSLVPQLLHDGHEVIVQDSGEFVRAIPTQGLTVLPYVPSLADEIAKCDLIVAPYDPAAYRTKGSGIVWDALASGVPVIAPAGTAIGTLVQSNGAGILFGALEADDVYRSILEARRNYERISRAAFRASLEWCSRHGIRHFVSAMLAKPQIE